MNAEQAEALNAIAEEVYQTAKEHGFHVKESVGNWCANLHGEVSELWEAYRKGRLSDPCDKPIQLSCAAEELADIVIRALDTATALGVDIGVAVMVKASYNQTRPFLHGGKRA
jgi:NTP pyrophosphatase (non-canonical NTP hydrolase)